MMHCPSNQLYATNQISLSGIDEMATRKIQPVPKDTPAICPFCGPEVQMILAEKAATLCQCSRRKIYHWIEEGDLHFVELDNNEVLVCGRSLSQKMDDLDSNTNKLSRRDDSIG